MRLTGFTIFCVFLLPLVSSALRFSHTVAAVLLFPRRLGEPQEIAHVAEMLIENDYMNGRLIELDGGLRF